MKRLKLLILIFSLALSIPLAYFVLKTYRGLEQEEAATLRYFAETIFDEMALMNDINAIGGGHVASSNTYRKPAGNNIEERLRTLEDLKAKGLVTEEEYLKRKEEILSQI